MYQEKLLRIKSALFVSSTSTAETIIKETNRFLPKCMPYSDIEHAIAKLPLPFCRKPIFIAAQILKTANLTSNMIPQPDVILAEAETVAHLRFYMTLVRGASFYQEAVKIISADDMVILKRESENQFDINAIMVCAETGELIGYVDRQLAKRVATQVNEMGGTIPGTVLKKFWNSFPKNTVGVEIYFALPRPVEGTI